MNAPPHKHHVACWRCRLKWKRTCKRTTNRIYITKLMQASALNGVIDCCCCGSGQDRTAVECQLHK
eukprot:scaffold411879_cov15-Prasinocladus_malaysianus.AAC.1